MSDLSLWYESPRGTKLSSKKFDLGQRIWIVGKLLVGLNTPPGTQIKIDLCDGFSPLATETSTDWQGMFWWDVILPDEQTLATVRVTAHSWLSSDIVIEDTIGIGVSTPAPSPLGLNWKWVMLAGGVGLAAAFLIVMLRKR